MVRTINKTAVRYQSPYLAQEIANLELIREPLRCFEIVDDPGISKASGPALLVWVPRYAVGFLDFKGGTREIGQQYAEELGIAPEDLVLNMDLEPTPRRFFPDSQPGDPVIVAGQKGTVLSVGVTGGIIRFENGREYPVRFADPDGE